ncbi:MAG TPA: hypothetical protein VLA04_00405 [Verrucomicrobiae bacterium]|nr:hypothetical protein [Verrucomicrobiae bacterium]
MTVTVVPVLRLRRATTGWSYKVPPNVKVQAGSLVIIPFRGRPNLGVVWQIEEDAKATESLFEVLTSTPLVRQPHRRLIEWLSEEGICSLSTALYVWLPAALRGFPLTKPVRAALAEWDRKQPYPQKGAGIKQHAILVPSKREEAEQSLAKKYAEIFRSTFSDSTPAQEWTTWLSIAHGETHVATGRERVLFAPWVNLRHITVVEPEDISYHTGQTPYLNLTDAAHVLAEASHAEETFRSNLPLPAAQLFWPSASSTTSTAPSAEITDLGHDRIINERLIGYISDALAKNQHSLLLYNAHDRFKTEEDGTRSVIPGIETLTRQLVGALGLPSLPPTIHLGTRAMLTSLPHPVGLAAIISIDPLLHQVSLADQAHGWGDVGRLMQTGAPLLIQTREPGHPLVQAVANNTFAEYCVRTIEDARKAGLPPFVEQVVCAVPHDAEADPTPPELMETLQKAKSGLWEISYPRQTSRRGKPLLIITLTAPQGTRLPLALRKELAALPRPWKVERGPWYAI